MKTTTLKLLNISILSFILLSIASPAISSTSGQLTNESIEEADSNNVLPEKGSADKLPVSRNIIMIWMGVLCIAMLMTLISSLRSKRRILHILENEDLLRAHHAFNIFSKNLDKIMQEKDSDIEGTITALDGEVRKYFSNRLNLDKDPLGYDDIADYLSKAGVKHDSLSSIKDFFVRGDSGNPSEPVDKIINIDETMTTAVNTINDIERTLSECFKIKKGR